MLRALIKRAVTGDSRAASEAMDLMRFRFGLNYRQAFETAQRECPQLTLAQWDALLANEED